MNNKFIIALIVILLGGVTYFMSYNYNASVSNQYDNSKILNQKNFSVEILSDTENIQPNIDTEIRFRIKNGEDNILKDFAVAHEKLMHLIIVRHDLAYFQHLHPEFNQKTGIFAVNAKFPTDGPYRIFPDFTPAKEAGNPRLLAITVYKDLNIGDLTKYQKISLAADNESRKNIDNFQITYLFPDINGIKNQEDINYSLLINENGSPVTGLENYLGAKGHSVILKSGSLDYIHTHALEKEPQNGDGHSMEHGAMLEEAKDNQIDFATKFPGTGLYKIFTQFQIRNKIQTTDYTVFVK